MTFRDACLHYENDFLDFHKVKPQLSKRSDLHAFLLLDKLVPGKRDVVACAEHDEIWLDIDVEKLDKVATEEQMLELVRCGVWYDTSTGSLAMFV